MLADLVADFDALVPVMTICRSSAALRRLTRVAAQLAGLVCLTLIELDDRTAFRRWARTARLAAAEIDDPATQAWVSAAVTRAVAAARGPVRVLALADADPEGTLGAALAAAPNEVWVVRPDAHVAAVLHRPTAAETVAALDRAAGHSATPRTRKENHDGALPALR